MTAVAWAAGEPVDVVMPPCAAPARWSPLARVPGRLPYPLEVTA